MKKIAIVEGTSWTEVVETEKTIICIQQRIVINLAPVLGLAHG